MTVVWIATVDTQYGEQGDPRVPKRAYASTSIGLRRDFLPSTCTPPPSQNQPPIPRSLRVRVRAGSVTLKRPGSWGSVFDGRERRMTDTCARHRLAIGNGRESSVVGTPAMTPDATRMRISTPRYSEKQGVDQTGTLTRGTVSKRRWLKGGVEKFWKFPPSPPAVTPFQYGVNAETVLRTSKRVPFPSDRLSTKLQTKRRARSLDMERTKE
ncbi:unnamed protein product, partial [Iphiclides podalirius]